MISEPFEARLDRFFREGRSAIAGVRDGYGERLAGFLSGLRQVLKLARAEIQDYERVHASRFNVFDYIAPDENRLSDILADLLDPDGKHGQGTLFLELLLKRCGVELAEPLSGAKVHREASTTYLANDARRMDVRIDFGTFGIGIENKPWAADQPGQIHDYLLNLDRHYNGQFLLLYLSGSGEPPAEHSATSAELADRRFRMWTFAGELAGWLAEAEAMCKAERVRSFLRNFREYVRQMFK